MTEILQKVLQYQYQLQTQTQVPVWSIASEEVVYATARDKKPAYGKRSQWLAFIFFMSEKLYIADLLIFSIGLSRLFSIFRKIPKKTISKTCQFKKVFIYFNVSSMEYVYKICQNATEESMLSIHLPSFIGAEKIGRPALLQCIIELARHAFGHSAKLKTTIPEIKKYKKHFLTVCARNIGDYVFFHLFWKMASSKGVKEAIFLSLHASTYACTESKVKSFLFQHGLLNLGLLMPKVDHMYVLTTIEAMHLKKLMPNTKSELIKQTILLETQKKHVVIVLLPKLPYQRHYPVISNFIDWAKQKNLTVVIRPTNKATQNEVSVYSTQFFQCLVDDIKRSINDSLSFWQPKFVAAWTSTCLSTAIENGILPISFMSKEDPLWDQMIYPLRKRVLYWPSESETIAETLTSVDKYQERVLYLQQQV